MRIRKEGQKHIHRRLELQRKQDFFYLGNVLGGGGRTSGTGGRMGGDEFEIIVPEWIFEGLDFKKQKE